MSQNITYHSVIPENNKNAYSEFDVVDFRAELKGVMMNLNSVRISGVFDIRDETGAQISAKRCQLDKNTGCHSFFQQIQTFVGGQSIDNIMEYPRLVKQLTSASENQADMFQSHNLCELKAPCDIVAQQMLSGETIPTQGATAIRKNMDFSCKPMISLNQVYSDRRQLSASKASDVRVVVTLARDASVMYGLDVVANYTYSLSDLRLEYTSYPDDGNTEPIVFKRRQGLKQSFASTSAQLNFQYPMLVSSVYGSFLSQADENQPSKNNVALQKPPGVRTMSFFFNNATNEYVTYQLRSQVEIVERYIDAIGNSGHNSASLMNLANNNGYGIGLNLQEMVDLSKTKFSVVIESQLPSSEPMLLVLFAEGVGQF